MNLKKIMIGAFLLCAGTLTLMAQEGNNVHNDIREMSKVTDPVKSIILKEKIIKEYKLEDKKDFELIDLLNGNIAVAYAMNKKDAEFEQYINLIKNKFNQTFMMNMAVNKLLDENVDNEYANILAARTLERYYSFKEDPSAMPDGYKQEDWERFMSYSKFSYYDTYAKSLLALKKYNEALQYQRMGFDGDPADAFPSSVERYAKLLELNKQSEKAKEFLLKIAKKGKLNEGMIAQLEKFYVAEKGSNEKFTMYLDSLQNSVQSELIKELKTRMINKPAPNFTLKDIKGQEVSLSDYKGKIVVLDLWATWCVPCIKSFPAMQKEVEKHPDVVFLFIAVQERGDDVLERVKKFMDKNDYPFNVLLDEPVSKGSKEFKITSSYKPQGIPAKYFIDKKGNLQFESKGFSTDSELMNEIDAIISVLKS